MHNKKIIIEICAPTIQSAINAEKGGADRIELCQNLSEGGTTPSFGAIKYCIEHLTIPTNVLIRPRSGDFCYNDAEYETIKNDIQLCKELGINGIVVGFLHRDLTIDLEKTKEIVALASPMEVTFHRAIDVCADWRIAIEQIIEAGCHRILTSGTYPTAQQGIDIIKEMVSIANNRIIILVGSGVNHTNIEEIINKTNVFELHSSCTLPVSNQISKVNSDKIDDPSNYIHKESNLELIKKILSLPIHKNIK